MPHQISNLGISEHPNTRTQSISRFVGTSGIIFKLSICTYLTSNIIYYPIGHGHKPA